MDTETLGMITEMTNLIKDVTNDEYGEKYFNTAIKISESNKNIFTNDEF